MALHSLYFVLASDLLVEPVEDRGDVIPNLDTTGYFSTLDRTISLTPTASPSILNIDDTSGDSTFNDDGQFDEQTLDGAAFGFNDGAGIETNYVYTLERPDGSRFKVYSVAINNDPGIGGATADQVVGFVSTAKLEPGVTYTIKDSSSFSSVDYSDLATCFANGTMIRTSDGERPIESLRVGDLVETQDRGMQPIRWVGSRRLSSNQLAVSENLRPICIKAGALAPGLPKRDLIVSPQHRVLVRSTIAERMFGSTEVLVAVKQLLDVPGVSICNGLSEITYFHMMFDQHEVVCSDGAMTESFFIGPQALKAIGQEARDEVLTLFPQLADRSYRPNPARPFAIGKKARRLAARHVKNDQHFVA